MNHVYRLVWKHSASQVVPVSELARRSRPGRSARTRSTRGGKAAQALLLIGSALSFSAVSLAGPAGGQVVAGAGQITQSGTTTTVSQTSQNLSLNWQSFNVGAHESVNFVQPGASSVAVNRVVGNGASQILGHLNANGQVWLINPNGVLFGKGSQVNVGGLVASTLDTAGAPDGTTHFGGNSTGSVVNQGTITAASGGYVALLGNTVSNQGVVTAKLGTVALGAGSAAALTFSGDHLLQVEVDASTLGNLAENRGLVAADGGTVYMTAGARNSILASSVNNTGVVRASTVENHNGTVVLTADGQAGEVTVAGMVDVSAGQGTGGQVTATAQHIDVAANAKIDAAGSAGGGSIHIGGGWEGGGGLAQATSVRVADSATLDASATKNGNGGEIVVRSDVDDPSSTALVHGTLQANGGRQSGDGGRIETSGHYLDVSGSAVSTSASKGKPGEWLLDPWNVTIAASGTTLSGSTYTPTANSTISASSIATALQNGTSVTITTGTTGSVIGDIQVNAPITKASGDTDVTLTLQAADSIIVNSPISTTGGTGKLNVNLYADNNGGTHDGVGVTILNSSITTGGGAINFGNGATMTVNGVANTLVGGDVYVGGASGVNLSTAGGNVAVNGQLIIANTSGLSIDTTNGSGAAGNVTFGGSIDSGDTYALISSFGNVTWTAALADAKSGVGASVGDTYLATLTSRLENAVAGYDANYAQSWLGGARVFGLGTDAEWRWVAGPEGLQDNGHGLAFFTQNTGSNGGVAINGAYTNWNPSTPEPNNFGGSNLSQSGSGEWTLQFVGTQGQWNDLNPNTNSLPFVKETNLANSPLTVNAGSVKNVTFNGAIGQVKPLAALNVTGQIIGLSDTGTSPSTNIATSGPITLNGQVQVDGTNKNVLVVTAPSVTTTYGAALPTLTPTYSGFVNSDTVASLTTLATASTTGSTSFVSSAPIIASGAVDPDYFFIYNPGTLIVNPAPLTVTGTTVGAKTYDGTTAASLSNGVLSGVIGGDLANLTLTQAGAFVSANASPSAAVTVSDTLGGSAAGNYVLVQPTGLTGTISPAHVTVTGTQTGQDKVYDGTTAATISGGTLSGVLGSDLAHVSLQGRFADANAGSNISITDFLSGSAAGNYVIISQPSFSADITRAPLSIAGTEVASSKTYDGTTVAAVSGGTLSGLVMSDVGQVSLAGTFTSPDAGSSIPVALSLAGSQAGNYSLSGAPSLAADINRAPLTIAGTEIASSKTYDGTTVAAVSGGTLSGLVMSDVGQVSLAGAFSSADAGTDIPVALSLTGSRAADYSLSGAPSLAADINRALLTIAGTEVASSKTYDGTTVAAVSGGTLSGLVMSDVGQVSLVGAFTSPDAGSSIPVTLSLTGSQAGNYSLSGAPSLAADINRALLTIAGTEVASSKTYDGTTAATVAGGMLAGLISGDAAEVSLTGTFASANAGTGIPVVLALSGARAGNYALSAPNLSADIGRATLTISGTETAASRTYDGTTAASISGGTLTGLLPGDDGSVAVIGTFASPNAGQNIPVLTTLVGPGAANYSLASPAIAANISPAALLATAGPVAMNVGGTPPSLSGSFNGFVNRETLDSLLASGYRSSWTTTADAQSAAGQYSIVGSFNDPNYAVTQATGNSTAMTASVASPPTAASSGSILVTQFVPPVNSATAGGSGGFGAAAGGHASGAGNANSMGGSSGSSGGGSSLTADASGAGPGSGSEGATSNGSASSLGSTGAGSNGSGSSRDSADASANGSESSAGGASGESSDGGRGGADAGSSDAGSGGNASVASTSSSSSSSDAASAASNGSTRSTLSEFGGRRLYVIDGGMNAGDSTTTP